MLARHAATRAARRGVVLVLILGMLGLLALIGVAFATFSGQAQVGARLYSQKLYEPRVQDLMEFALGQLINDTDNPVSALRGHGILRDMYGNDAISNGALDRTLNPSTGQVVALTIVSAATGSIPGTAQVETNIIQSATYDAGAFARWILRTQTPPSGGTAPVAQTVEILDDTIGASSMSGFPPVHFLTVTAPDTTTTYSYGAISPTAVLSNLLQNQSFVLDGRYQRAFNGPGMAAAYAGLPAPASVFGNFRINGGILAGNSSVAYPGNPNAAGMDEDYDAPDLENWFLALQSADGQVVIPSFHRPGILQYQTDPMTGQVVLNDWAINQGIGSPRILRPRAADHPQSGSFQNSTTGIYTGGAFPDLVPDTNGTAATNPNYGKITYDVDNDGDGTKEAVWLDLGHPIMRDASGRMFKPLFAFTVVGLNGRLPLNTAGNLQKRGIPIPANDTFPVPLFDHASHLGYSPNEVNPEYAFAASASSNPVSALQRLLTGLRQPSSGAAIPGRWGEPELIPAAASLTFGSGVLNNPVRAGRSYPFVDGIDADYDGLDFVPLHAPTAMPPTFPEQSDFPDSAGAMLLASERIRRFVTPIDPTGNGRVLPYDTLPGGPFDFGNGFDKRGRSGFFEYFRPPGLPQNLASLGTPVVPDLSTNPYHGYESFRNPLGSPIDDPLDMTRKRPTTNAEYLAAMPWNVSGTTAPTYNGNINSSNPTPRPAPMPGTPYPALTDYGLYPGYPYPPTSSSVVFPGGTLALNEADQMNLYRPEIYDAPFGVPDLEWLYRKHDIDGASLSSRLPALVPEVFDPRFNTTDALLRSRLFSHESWETTNFVWSNDNPANVFPNNYRFGQGVNSSFWMLDNFLYPTPATRTGYVTTPSVAHRDRKVNLNYPLPPSNNPYEPVRLKWITETYQLLKVILPPKAVDDPRELATLGQFAVNIIDFRDSDTAITIWTNPDVRQDAGSTTAQPALHLPTLADGTPDTAFAAPTTTPLVHYGMEYCPVAINEALAYTFQRKTAGGATPNPRFFVELVNTLTRDAGPTLDGVGNGTASNLDLNGWDLVVLPDDTTDARTTGSYGALPTAGRPEPATGQIPEAIATLLLTPPAMGTPPVVAVGTTGPLSNPGTNPNPIKGIVWSGGMTPSWDPDYFILGYPNPDPTSEGDKVPGGTTGQMPTPDSVLAGSTDTLLPASPAANKYYWVYLRRPANPFAPASATNPMVVVDSMQFPYLKSAGTPGPMVGSDDTATPGTQEIWSVQRRQPYRGGQAVANPPPTLPAAYGYSEQLEFAPASTGTGGTFGLYGTNAQDPRTNLITGEIRNKLGKQNSNVEDWDGFVFHDRDFMSVAELMLVPGCPPGLFTKQFVERQVDPAAPPPPAPPATPGSGPPSTSGSPLPGSAPHSYPYLVDNFFYSADGTTTTDNPPSASTPGTGWVNGGPTGTGWYRMFEFFEVPSPVLGAIGPVADGHNFDWYREDRRPGLINLNLIIDEEVFFGLIDDPRMNYASALSSSPALPQVVTRIDASGAPTAGYTMQDRGFYYVDPNPVTTATPVSTMKAAFADFLRERSGGSNFLFGAAADAPYHSLSYPDIRFTLMRPALNTTANSLKGPIPATPKPPPVPPRRLLQVPEAKVWDPTTMAFVDNVWNTSTSRLADGGFVLADIQTNGTPVPRYFLGANGTDDNRQHPYFRTEMLQKLMNLTTVRTHQYAVWVTVGYFEVTQPGNPRLAFTNPALAYDQLGQELDAQVGRNVRYRSFFVLDRTRAGGYNPTNPASFRDAVVFQRRIE